MIIDCHAHLVPPALLDAIRADKASFPSVKLIEEAGSLGFAFAGNKPTRPVSKPLSDIAARLKWLDDNKIERQVVGGWLDMFAYEIPAEEGLRRNSRGLFRWPPCRCRTAPAPPKC
jgi:aminocarboxymuconate-semialdehyde decarboxylase